MAWEREEVGFFERISAGSNDWANIYAPGEDGNFIKSPEFVCSGTIEELIVTWDLSQEVELSFGLYKNPILYKLGLPLTLSSGMGQVNWIDSLPR